MGALPALLTAQTPTSVSTSVSADTLLTSTRTLQANVYFTGVDTSGNDDVWRSDGTVSGTARVTNTGQSGQGPSPMGAVGGRMYYSAPHAGSGGYAVYAYDPVTMTDETIHLFASPPSQVFAPVGIGSTAYFIVWSGTSTDFEFITSDGTAAGTTVTMTQPTTGYNPGRPASYGGQIVIGLPGANGVEPHIGDWTSSGMTEIIDINPTGDSDPDVLGELNGVCLFAAYDPAFGTSLYQTDGTSGGTSRISNGVFANTGFGAPYVRAGNLFYFHYDTGSNTQLWRTDGTAAGTFQLTNFSGTTSAHLSIHPSGSFVYFDVATAAGLELWRTDGSLTGTNLVTALTNTSQVTMMAAGGILYLLRYDGSTNTSSLWTSDGIAGGTTFLTDAGVPTAQWVLLGEVATGLLFSTDTGTTRQLWTIDASPPPTGGGGSGGSGGGGGGCTVVSASAAPFGIVLLAIVFGRRRRRTTRP